jgi:hypothetical protein
MSLDTHELELKRQQLDLQLAECTSAWTTKRNEMLSVAGLANARLQGIPTAPTISIGDIEASFLLAPDRDDWRSLEEMASIFRDRVADMRAAEVPEVEDLSEAAAEELDNLIKLASEQNAGRKSLFRARQTEVAQRLSVARRLAALQEDLQKNLDAQKLRNFGSKMADTFAPDYCPTCSQPIQDTLLAQQASAAVMRVEDNIEYIRSQRTIFQRLSAQVDAAILNIDRRLAATI